MLSGLKYFTYILASGLVVFLLGNYIEVPNVNINNIQANVFEWEKQVEVYFPNITKGSNEDCSRVFAVSRTIPNAETFGPGAITELLKGPSARDKEAGFSTSINTGVLLQKFDIRDRVAYVDFSSRLSQTGGSCMVESIRSQIETTLNSLPDIDSTTISVNGQTDGILEP